MKRYLLPFNEFNESSDRKEQLRGYPVSISSLRKETGTLVLTLGIFILVAATGLALAAGLFLNSPSATGDAITYK